MLLVCDTTVSPRAEKLRNKLFSLGYPCALCSSAEIGSRLPLRIIVTFTDAADEIGHTPYVGYPVIALGAGHVNSAINAVSAGDESTLIDRINARFREIYGINDSCCFQFGVRCPPYLFIADEFMMLYGRSVVFTETEYMIFKYLCSFRHDGCIIPARTIYGYCFGKHKLSEERISGNVAVNIRNINKKLSRISNNAVIKSKREQGYYLESL